jgi:O-antigen ligase
MKRLSLIDLQNFSFLAAVFFIHLSAVPGVVGGLAGLFLLLYLIFFIFNRSVQNRFFRTGLEYPFLFYILASAISCYDAYIFSWSVGKTLSLTLAIGLFYLLLAGLNKQNFSKFLNVLFYGGLILCLAGFLQFITYYLVELWQINVPILNYLVDQAKAMPRISSLFLARSGTNVYACYLGLFLPLISVILWQKKMPLLIKLFAAFLIIFNVLFSYSRALYIGIFAVALIRVIFFSKKKVLILSGIIFLLTVLSFIPPINSTIRSIFNNKDNSNIEHFQTFQSALSLIAKHPLNGWGADHVSRKIRKSGQGWVDGHGYKMEVNAKNWTPTKFYEVREAAKKAGVISIDSPHNIYLWNMIDTGLLGLGAFLFILLVIYRKILKQMQGRSKNKYLAEGLFYGFNIFLLYGFFQDSLNAPIMTSFFWLFLILVCALEKYNKQEVIV